MVPASWYVGLGAVLFVIGVLGVLVRRNPLVIFMSIEIMLNAANLALVAFGQRHGSVDGQALVFFVLCVAAAEVAARAPRSLGPFPLPPPPPGGAPPPAPRAAPTPSHSRGPPAMGGPHPRPV